VAVRLSGQTYSRPADACQAAGISKNTLVQWIRVGILPQANIRVAEAGGHLRGTRYAD